MPQVTFAPAIQRHVAVPPLDVGGETVAAALHDCLRQAPGLQAYLFDDQGRLRPHVTIFIDGTMIRDRRALSDRLQATSRVYVVQALSGG
ncbi:thiamine biosynthesis protein ThiS [Pandoraea terrae]|uniref:Thiamine biosynthesis protein ThiS n=1 Tax=Pandoraea terrae TaxID=1537710 RepID=A0A5E4YNA3_9BURK|nr:MoaD/ThiS family protein [Pandoraea terrae]VVE49730.1 thiamine biosynthesis protein ThiS [Pandoraea terrae]